MIPMYQVPQVITSSRLPVNSRLSTDSWLMIQHYKRGCFGSTRYCCARYTFTDEDDYPLCFFCFMFFRSHVFSMGKLPSKLALLQNFRCLVVYIDFLRDAIIPGTHYIIWKKKIGRPWDRLLPETHPFKLCMYQAVLEIEIPFPILNLDFPYLFRRSSVLCISRFSVLNQDRIS